MGTTPMKCQRTGGKKRSHCLPSSDKDFHGLCTVCRGHCNLDVCCEGLPEHWAKVQSYHAHLDEQRQKCHFWQASFLLGLIMVVCKIYHHFHAMLRDLAILWYYCYINISDVLYYLDNPIISYIQSQIRISPISDVSKPPKKKKV